MSAGANVELVRLIHTQRSGELLLAAHAADSSGHCKVCHATNASSGRVVAPCNLWLAASEATSLCEGRCGMPRRLCGCLRLVEKL